MAAQLTYRTSSTPVVPTNTTTKNIPLTNLEMDANLKSIADELTRLADAAVAMSIALG